jgi:hypothetical protein
VDGEEEGDPDERSAEDELPVDLAEFPTEE